MFTNTEIASPRKTADLLQNIIALHEIIYRCRNLIIESLNNQNLSPDQKNDLQDFNWTLFMLEQTNGTQRDHLKRRSHLNPSQFQAHTDRYHSNSDLYNSVKVKITTGNYPLNINGETGDNWYDWSYAESETSDESSFKL